MSDNYREREIKVIETTSKRGDDFGNVITTVAYEIRAYNSDNEEDYEVLAWCDDLCEIFVWWYR